MPTPEERIKEERMREATRKGYMGMNGKLGTILQYLGKPIMGHGSPLYEATYLDTPYPEEEEEMGYFDEDDVTTEAGYLFDGLSRGIHMEIKYIDNTLTVTYAGYPVYIERSGDLEAFVPHNFWEQHVERLYSVAIKLQRADREVHRISKDQIKEAKRKGWLQEMWKRWGFKL